MREYLVAAERVEHLRALWPQIRLAQELAMTGTPAELTVPEILRRTAQGWLAILGPVTAGDLGSALGVGSDQVFQAMLQMEMAGTALRGIFEHDAVPGKPDGEAIADEQVQWCERRLLQRIHKRTLATLRKQIEPLSPATYMRWLLHWQHLGPKSQLCGEQGVLEALRSLEGFEAPAIEWERTLLPRRVADYDPRWLDTLCLLGVVGWGRISPHPAFYSADSGGPRRVVPTSMAPITFFVREQAFWMDLCMAEREVPEAALAASLSELALRVRACLSQYGAAFAGDLVRMLGAPAAEVSRALWELVAAGLATADGYDALRVLIDPRRKAVLQQAPRMKSASRNATGRWSLMGLPVDENAGDAVRCAAIREERIDSACRMLLRRYGVVFRDLLERETTSPRWRDLLGIFRRLEARGEIRGGRFLSGFGGEQFALPEALESLRSTRRAAPGHEETVVAAADPMNLAGIVVPGERVAAIPGRSVVFVDGVCASTNAEKSSPDETIPLPESVLFNESVSLVLPLEQTGQGRVDRL